MDPGADPENPSQIPHPSPANPREIAGTALAPFTRVTSIFALWLGLWATPQPLSLDTGSDLGAMVEGVDPDLLPLYAALELPALHGVGPLVETVARGLLTMPRTPSAQLSGFGIWIDLLSLEIDTAPPPTVAEAAQDF